MKRSLRIFWTIALMFFVTGCGGYKVVGYSLPEVLPDPTQDNQDAVVKVGSQVRLNLMDGSRPEGRVALINPQEIVLESQGKSTQPRGFTAAQVCSIESKPGSGGGGSTVTTVLVVGGFALVVGGVILAESLSDLNSIGN